MAGKLDPNPCEFLLPDLGEGLTEADLIEWCVQPGQTVKDSDVLAKLETAKAVMDVCSDRAGTIAILHGKPGDTLKVHAPLVTFTEAIPSDDTNGNPAEPERKDSGTVVGSIQEDMDFSAAPGKVRAAPAVRRMARDLGIDLDTITGTGLGGRITTRDVQAAANARVRPAPTPVRPSASKPPEVRRPVVRPSIPGGGQDVTIIPFKGIRKVIAERLAISMQRAVQITVMDEADIQELDQFRRRFIAATGEKVSFLSFVAAAVVRALSDPVFAMLNATVDDEREEIQQHHRIHLGIATDTEHGLMVPVVRDANQLSILEMARHISTLATQARERSILPQDLKGSTFTISNFGSLAGRFATPVINYPEVAILAIGRAREGVVARNGLLGVGKLLPLSMSCDHRVIDGGLAAMMLARIIELLQRPDELIPAK